MRRNWSIALALAACATAATACSDSTGPSAETRAAAGIYMLQATGYQWGPESGTIYLLPNGRAERHVWYARDGQPSEEDVAKGTFRVKGSAISFELVPQSATNLTWHLTGTIDGPTLTLSYPGPADGQVTETYRR